MIACANASQYGNNAYIAPTASMKDGLMDVIVMKPFPTIEGAYVLLQMFTKTLLNNNHVQLSQTKSSMSSARNLARYTSTATPS